jgi:hypothetical protein
MPGYRPSRGDLFLAGLIDTDTHHVHVHLSRRR